MDLVAGGAGAEPGGEVLRDGPVERATACVSEVGGNRPPLRPVTDILARERVRDLVQQYLVHLVVVTAQRHVP